MAIILSAKSLEAIILADRRPAYVIRDDWIDEDAALRDWPELAHHREVMSRAIAAVGRLDVETLYRDWLGTGVVVAPRLVAITRHMVDAMDLQDDKGELVPKTPAWLDFGHEDGGTCGPRVRISRVALVHPVFDFALLELDDTVDPARVATFDARPLLPDENLQVCVVGYPAFDGRNGSEVMEAVFGSLYDVKRLMPGRLMPNNPAMAPPAPLSHDCSTLGGTGGAPLIDIKTGLVVGINFAGQYNVANYAVAARDLARDPYLRLAGCQFSDWVLPDWMADWTPYAPSLPVGRVPIQAGAPAPSPDPAPVAAPDADPAPGPPDEILAPDRLLALNSILKRAGFASATRVRSLFSVLGVDFLNWLPSDGSPGDVLLQRMADINRANYREHTHVALHIVVSTARQMASHNKGLVRGLTEYLDEIEAWEAAHLPPL